MTRRRSLPVLFLSAVLAFLLSDGERIAVTGQAMLNVVASGLDNPRGLAVGTDGALYVAEAGSGGDSSLCLPAPEAPPGTDACYGPTGAITRISAPGVQERVATGLPSLAVPSGTGALGPHDIAFGFGKAYITIGLGANPADRAPFTAAGIRLGSLVELESTGEWRYVVDLSAIEGRENPDGQALDSNPYGGVILQDGGAVADAGANALLKVALDGSVSVLAAFPPRLAPTPGGPGDVLMQAVPTTVVLGPDGNLYVGELTGFPFPVGAARVYRVPVNGGTPVVFGSGFTNIIDIAVADNGTAYVLEHDADSLLGPGDAGRLTRVTPNGTRTVIASDGLVLPGGVVIGSDGALYVTNHSTSAGTGEVVRIEP